MKKTVKKTNVTQQKIDHVLGEWALYFETEWYILIEMRKHWQPQAIATFDTTRVHFCRISNICVFVYSPFVEAMYLVLQSSFTHRHQYKILRGRGGVYNRHINRNRKLNESKAGYVPSDCLQLSFRKYLYIRRMGIHLLQHWPKSLSRSVRGTNEKKSLLVWRNHRRNKLTVLRTYLGYLT